VEEPNTSGTGCSSYADPEGRLAGPQSKMPLGFLQQGPLTSRLRGGGEEPKKDAEEDAEAVSKETGEPDETMPEPEEPAGTKPGLQELPGTKNGSPGGRQTRSMCNGRTRYRCSSANHVRKPWLSPSAYLTGLLVESASLYKLCCFVQDECSLS
jgi:hypothetical protein